MTFDEVQDLLAKPKKLVTEEGYLLDMYCLDQKQPMAIELKLTDVETKKFLFRLSIKQSSKIGYKITFHLMNSNGNIPLSRLDINGSHFNPREITAKVPDFLKVHVGERILSSHLHYAVEGYDNLAWALSLKDVNDSRLKDVESSSKTITTDIAKALTGYFTYLNVLTKLEINLALL